MKIPVYVYSILSQIHCEFDQDAPYVFKHGTINCVS
jgi:hypothetical protein